jgi:hypothetical protein
VSEKSWGRGWPHCQKHKGTDRKHLARGLCAACYMEETRAGTLHDWPTTPSVAAAPEAAEQETPVAPRSAPKWHYNHAACKGCGTTTRPHHSDSYCTQCVMEQQGDTPAQAARKIAQGLEAVEAPLTTPQRERLGVLMERKHGGPRASTAPTPATSAPRPAHRDRPHHHPGRLHHGGAARGDQRARCGDAAPGQDSLDLAARYARIAQIVGGQ